MVSLEVVVGNLMSPAIMFFVLGVISVLVKSDLEIPDTIGTAITLFILISIGLKAGIAVNEKGLAEVIMPIISAIAIGILITVLVYFAMSKIGFDSGNAGSIAGHFGACSSVTLTTVLVFLEQTGVAFEEFVPALYPFMDTAALITGIVLGHAGLKGGSSEDSIWDILRISLTAKSTVLIIGGFFIGLLTGAEGAKSLMPFYTDIFNPNYSSVSA